MFAHGQARDPYMVGLVPLCTPGIWRGGGVFVCLGESCFCSAVIVIVHCLSQCYVVIVHCLFLLLLFIICLSVLLVLFIVCFVCY